jgi:hypothetical protein
VLNFYVLASYIFKTTNFNLFVISKFLLLSIKVSQSLSKSLLSDLLHIPCTNTLAALDKVIQLGRDHFIHRISRILEG